MHRAHALVALLALFVSFAAQPAEAASDKRLVNLGLWAPPDVDPKVERTLEDTVSTSVFGAAKARGYALVPLRKVSGLEEQARACPKQACRQEILRRLAADYGLFGSVEPRARGYRVSFWLEDAKTGALVRAVRLEGEVPVLVGGLRRAVEDVLEAASPKDAVERAKLTKAAQAYLAKERLDDAVRAYERAIEIAPFSAESARLSLEVLALFDRRDDEARLLEAVDAAIEMYGPRSAWAKAGIGGEAVQAEVRRVLLEVLSRRGTTAHRKALALSKERDAHKRKALLEHARDLYRRYVFDLGVLDEGTLTGDDLDEAQEIAFYLGEVLYELAAFDEAARAYRAVRDTEGARQRKEAARNVLFAVEQQLAAAGSQEGSGEGAIDLEAAPKLMEPRRELSPLARAFVDDAERFAAVAPDHADVPAVLYRAASVELSFGRAEEGRALLSRVATTWPKSQAGRAAAAALRSL